MDPSTQSSSVSSSSSFAGQPTTLLAACRDQLRQRRFKIQAAVVTVSVLAYVLMGVVRPNLISGWLNRNESAAIATLKNISSGQSQMQASGLIDVDGNGQGEYGFFAELAGAVPPRSKSAPLSTPVLSPSFGKVVGGRVQRSGYWFQMFLPNVEGGWAAELAEGGAGGDILASDAEVLWMCYAWPVDKGTTGNRAFFINQTGDVLSTNMAHESYTSDSRPFAGSSAFAAGSGGLVAAANTVDTRGNTWVVI